jgi:glycine cleavage system pyridoxal-binding protein P
LRLLILRRSGFIPPYMYGEKRPVAAAVFDSATHHVRRVPGKIVELSEDFEQVS